MDRPSTENDGKTPPDRLTEGYLLGPIYGPFTLILSAARVTPLQGHCRLKRDGRSTATARGGPQLLRLDLIEAGSKRTRFAIERKHESIQRGVRCHRLPDDKIRRSQRDPRRTGERMELPERAQ